MILGCCSFLLPATSNAQQPSVSELVQQARELGIDQASLAELQQRAKARGIGDRELISVINSALELAGQKLPSDHIIQKALEGMSKGVAGSQIAQVLTRMQEATEQSARIVGPWMDRPGVRAMIERTGPETSQEVRSELIKSASRAIAQNTPARVVGDILSDLSEESVLARTHASNIATAIGILPELPTTATQPEVSRAFVVRALKGGFSGDDLQKLPAALNVAQMRSRLPAASVIQGVADQLQGNVPAAQILQNLLNGTTGGGPPGSVPRGLENIPDRGQE